MNVGASSLSLIQARTRVREIQTKLHRWANDDAQRRFDDLLNLVADPAFLLVAWDRVRSNTGARSAGVDGQTVRDIERRRGALAFLNDLRGQLKARTFQPVPVRERMIPKPGSAKLRRLGIPTVADRVVQGALKLVLEPIFEADFEPCSYGFRPRRRPHDAIAEIHNLASNSYEWVLDADITACFDEIDHTALTGRVRDRIADKRVLTLVKAFLKAGILSEDQVYRDNNAGTPQGGILSPLLANIALSVLDEQFAEAWRTTMATRADRSRRRRHGEPTYRLVRYADDFVVMVSGTRAHVETLRADVEAALAPMGLRLSEEKTRIAHIDEGFDFLGFRIRRDTKRGSKRRYVYTYPSKKALASIKRKMRAVTKQGTNNPLSSLLRQLNGMLRGWTNYFRHGVSNATFCYLRHFVWWRAVAWLRKKHRRANWKQLRRRYLLGTSRWPTDGDVTLFDPAAVAIIRYRFRGQQIPSPWSNPDVA
ncbi:group II intron reverse transcriptase/maturase [soil metagenome]